MLKLSNYFVDKEDGGACGEHAHGYVVESERGGSVFSDLEAFCFSENGLGLLFFGQGRSVFALEQFGIKDVLSLVSDREVDHFC